MNRSSAGRHRRIAHRPVRRAGRAAVTAGIVAAATVVGVHVGATAAAVTPVSTSHPVSATSASHDGH